jgi:hypothetical protein
VSGAALAAVDVAFEGLPPEPRIRVEGDGQATQRGAAAGRGETFIHNLHEPSDGSVAHASLELRSDPRADAALRGERGAHVEVAIDQLLGDVVVNEFRLKAVVQSCVRPLAAATRCDEVELLDNRGGDSSVVLLDGLRGETCRDDDLLRARGSAQLEDVKATTPGCNSELAVFSAGDAMAMQAPENRWKDGCGDQVRVALQPPLRVPITVWLVRRNADSEAAAAILHANEVFDRNKTGIVFTARTRDVTSSIAANRATILGCANADRLREGDFYDPKRINVYYVSQPWPASAFYTGQNCKSHRGIIFIGPAANVATLAHEFGHALSLFGGKKEGGHTEDVDGFDENNVMAGGGPPTRSHFSLGQAFRFNVDPRSWVNVNGLRSGPTQPCPAMQPPEPDPRCPRLQLDWERP